MDTATFHELLQPNGQLLIAAAAELTPTERTFLSCFEKLRKLAAATLVKAALETVILRRKAAAKFPHAEQMYFTREGLEQSTGHSVAAYRAKRYRGWGTVADLCSGIGGDALALATAGPGVEAVEADALRASMLLENATALGYQTQIRVHTGDALTIPLIGAEAAFADPSRRAGERRFLDPEEYTPSLTALRERFPSRFPLGVKVAPGIDLRQLERSDCEVEFIANEGELKECVLWFGPLQSARRRATILPQGESLVAATAPELLPVGVVDRFVFDPNSAVVRAGLAGLLAEQLNCRLIDPVVMLLTSPEPIHSAFGTTYRVDLAERLHVRQLRRYLNSQDVGRITPLNRGGPTDPNELVRSLKLKGSEHRFVILTRADGEPWVVVGDRLPQSEARPRSE